MGVLILLRDEEAFSILLSSILIYALVLVVLIMSVFIFLFLKERKKLLLHNKLFYLRRKYSKIGKNDPYKNDYKNEYEYVERKRPRVLKNAYW